MRNKKLFGIMALIAITGFSIIGFSLMSCDGGGGGGHTCSYVLRIYGWEGHCWECSCGSAGIFESHDGNPCIICGYENEVISFLQGTWAASGGRMFTFTDNLFDFGVNGDTVYSGNVSYDEELSLRLYNGLSIYHGPIQITDSTFTLFDGGYTGSQEIIATYTLFAASYKIGDTGPGGGIIFYVAPDGFTLVDTGETAYYLEAAPAFMQTSTRWSTATESPFIDISGTGTAIGTGRRNTALILLLDPTAPAAKLCSDFTGGGKNDWFLPSRNELEEMVKQGLTGNDISFWSSSQSFQYDYRALALSVYFGNITSNSLSKASTERVRAVRYVTEQ
jgi:hypothetical protein